MALTCVSPLVGSSGATSSLFALSGFGFTDDAATPGKCPATVAHWINVSSTNEKSSTVSVGLGFIMGTVLDCC